MNAHGGQDWLGMLIVVAAVTAGVLLDYLITRVLLARETRANQAALRSVREIASRCRRCGCQVRDGHEPDSAECRELQVERQARAEERAREWSA